MLRLRWACSSCSRGHYWCATSREWMKRTWRNRMRKVVPFVAVAGVAMLLAGFGHFGVDRTGHDECADARAEPLVVPPDSSLQPPQPGVTRPQDNNPSAQALDALF